MEQILIVESNSLLNNVSKLYENKEYRLQSTLQQIGDRFHERDINRVSFGRS